MDRASATGVEGKDGKGKVGSHSLVTVDQSAMSQRVRSQRTGIQAQGRVRDKNLVLETGRKRTS